MFVTLLLVACAPGDEAAEPVATMATAPTATAPPPVIAVTEAPLADAPATSEPATPVAESLPTAQSTAGTADQMVESAVVFGRNDDGTFFYGAPDAPVTLIDYSDFL